MAIIHDTITITSGNSMPSLGALIGSRVSNEIFDSVNTLGHKSFFGDDFDHMRHEFFDRYVKPMDQLNLEITKTVNALINPDRFRILESFEDFESIPLCMEIPIVVFAPVRQGILEGRMDGFGYSPDSIPEDDVYGRLIDNFTCEDVHASSDDEGYYEITGTLYTDDPELSDDELYAIRKTRDYIRDKILNNSDRDPTYIEMMRG